jgi:hypothetical protein
LLFRETGKPSGVFLSGASGKWFVLSGVEANATLHTAEMALSESKTL